MNKEILSIISSLEDTLSGAPWYGRPVYAILEEIDPSSVYEHPGGSAHSLIELLYHTISWAAFTLAHVANRPEDAQRFDEDLDWRMIDPTEHTWEKGLAELKQIHRDLVALLQTKDDALLEQPVKNRKYNYRFLLNGLIQHNIYHEAQIAYVNKLVNSQ